MHLRALLDGAAIDPSVLLSIPEDQDWATVDVTDVVCDSRAVRRGSLFCAVRGRRADGHDHAPQAVAAGAVALVSEQRLRLGVPNVVVRSTADVAGSLAASLHDHPSRAMRLFGVTGTNGKTTTTYLLDAIMSAEPARRVGVIGTVETRWPGATLESGLTTPDACVLQGLLAGHARRRRHRRRDGSVVTCARPGARRRLRVRGGRVHEPVAGPSRLPRPHGGLRRGEAAAVHTSLRDRRRGERRRPRGRAHRDDRAELGLDVWTFSKHEGSGADVVASDASFTLRSLRCTIGGSRVDVPFALAAPLTGTFNLENVLAATTVALAVGTPAASIAKGLAAARPVPGRLQAVPNERGLHVFVDYAHTPEALERVLASVRAVAPGAARLLVVYGAGGDRDRHKRPLMGLAVAEGADVAVLTSDNPRSEDPAAIAAEVVRGLPDARRPLVELDRRAAIALALREADAGDVVLIVGKGHEQGQQIGDTVVPFDDVTVAIELLGARA